MEDKDTGFNTSYNDSTPKSTFSIDLFRIAHLPPSKLINPNY